MFVLRLVVGLIWIDPLFVAHDQGGPFRICKVVRRHIGDACTIAHMVLTLFKVFHA